MRNMRSSDRGSFLDHNFFFLSLHAKWTLRNPFAWNIATNSLNFSSFYWPSKSTKLSKWSKHFANKPRASLLTHRSTQTNFLKEYFNYVIKILDENSPRLRSRCYFDSNTFISRCVRVAVCVCVCAFHRDQCLRKKRGLRNQSVHKLWFTFKLIDRLANFLGLHQRRWETPIARVGQERPIQSIVARDLQQRTPLLSSP